MKPVKDKCKQCGRVNWINNSRGVCVACVYENNHDGKSPQKVALERQKAKSYILPSKTNNRSNFDVYKPKKLKITGELKMFNEIWEERPHFCTNALCKNKRLNPHRFLGNVLKPIFFSHRKSKGAYPELRLCKDNIDILCEECHYIWDFGDREKVLIEII